MKKILITRPRADSEKLAEEVRTRGLEPLVEPMLEIVPLDVKFPDTEKYQALVFTSANGAAVFAGLSDARTLPVFAIGEATAESARTAGFTTVRSNGGSNIDSLNALLAGAELKPGLPVLHVCGAHAAGAVHIAGIPVERIVAYRAEKAKSFSPEFFQNLEEGALVAALFYSPRTAENFTELVEQQGCENKISTIKALCISDAVVKCLASLPWQDVQTAETPSRDGMRRLLDRLATTAAGERGTGTGSP